MNLLKTHIIKSNFIHICKVFSSTDSVDTSSLVLHTFPRSRNVPTFSPFCLKLETYLRMTDLPHTPSFNLMKLSSKKKKPWIEHNGNKIADSNFCIKYIAKEFAIDLNSHLSEKEYGVSQAIIRMVEENLLWTLAFHRWVDDLDLMRKNLPRGIVYKGALWFASRKAKQALYGQGIGRHSRDEIYEIAQDDISALSKILENNTFLFGDELCVADASLFGVLAQFVWDGSNSPQHHIIKQHQNLLQYCNNIRNLYWPDFEKPKQA